MTVRSDTGAMAPRTDDWSVIILTGGTGRRLDGVDKATLDLAGTTPLQLVLDSLPTGIPVVVAGDPVTTSRQVTFRREDPPGAGPAAGIAAALSDISTELVGILAVDMPWAVPVLMRAVDDLSIDHDADAVVPVDADGRDQLLCSAWRTSALRRAVDGSGDLTNRPVRDLFVDASVLHLPLHSEDDLADIDTPQDLVLARERAHRRGRRT